MEEKEVTQDNSSDSSEKAQEEKEETQDNSSDSSEKAQEEKEENNDNSNSDSEQECETDNNDNKDNSSDVPEQEQLTSTVENNPDTDSKAENENIENSENTDLLENGNTEQIILYSADTENADYETLTKQLDSIISINTYICASNIVICFCLFFIIGSLLARSIWDKMKGA